MAHAATGMFRGGMSSRDADQKKGTGRNRWSSANTARAVFEISSVSPSAHSSSIYMSLKFKLECNQNYALLIYQHMHYCPCLALVRGWRCFPPLYNNSSAPVGRSAGSASDSEN